MSPEAFPQAGQIASTTTELVGHEITFDDRFEHLYVPLKLLAKPDALFITQQGTQCEILQVLEDGSSVLARFALENGHYQTHVDTKNLEYVSSPHR